MRVGAVFLVLVPEVEIDTMLIYWKKLLLNEIKNIKAELCKWLKFLKVENMWSGWLNASYLFQWLYHTRTHLRAHQFTS